MRNYSPQELERIERIIAETPRPEPEPAPEDRELGTLTMLQVLLAGGWMALLAITLTWLPEQTRQALQEGDPGGAVLRPVPYSAAILAMLAVQMALRGRINRVRERRANRENMLLEHPIPCRDCPNRWRRHSAPNAPAPGRRPPFAMPGGPRTTIPSAGTSRTASSPSGAAAASCWSTGPPAWAAGSGKCWNIPTTPWGPPTSPHSRPSHTPFADGEQEQDTGK